MSHGDEERIERQDVEAFLETRRELGPAYEREIVHRDDLVLLDS